MIDLRNIEFYNTPDGAVMVKKQGEQPKELLPNDFEFIDSLLSKITERYPEAIEAMEKLYDKSKPNRRYFIFRMVDRFCRCNFGRYDQTKMDIDEYGEINLEQIDCPLQATGDCPFFGVICKPREMISLSAREIQICREVAKGLTNHEIANSLQISPFTVLKHRRNIREKLGAVNTAQMMEIVKDIL